MCPPIQQGLTLGRSHFRFHTQHKVPNWSIAKLDRLSPKESN
jgi:hypothetical protein